MDASLTTQANDSVPEALRIVLPPPTDKDPIGAMQAVMRGLVLDQQHPVALEIATLSQKPCLIVRATLPSALDHVETILLAQFPEIQTHFLLESEDPFHLAAEETVSAVELTIRENEVSSGERDPLLGLLTALGKLPEHIRVVLQIGLASATPALPTPSPSRTNITSSLSNITGKFISASVSNATGKLVATGIATITDKLGNPNGNSKPEQPLVLGMFSSSRDVRYFSTANLIWMLLLFLIFAPFLPSWLPAAMVQSMAFGQPFAPTAGQIQQIIFSVLGLLFAEGLFIFAAYKLMHRFLIHPTNETTLNKEKLAQTISSSKDPVDSKSAYRSRIRLYIFGPKTPDESKTFSHFATRLTSYYNEQEKEREETLLRLIAIYRQFFLIESTSIPEKAAELLLSRDFTKTNHGWHWDLSRSGQLINFHLLATLWHFPKASRGKDPKKQVARTARVFPLPSDLASQIGGRKSIGFVEQNGRRQPFSLPSQFFTQHTLIAGKSIQGKNAFLKQIANSAMNVGGLLLIDPLGSLCEQILPLVPPQRAEDVVLIDLADNSVSIGLNSLDVTLGGERDKTIADLVNLLAHIWGAKVEKAFEMCLYLLFAANKVIVTNDPNNGPTQQYTLLDVLPLLSNGHFRRSVLRTVHDDYLHRWWHDYYENLSSEEKKKIANPLITKMAIFETTSARRIIGQSSSTLNLGKMISEKKIILLNLASDIVGKEVASFVGTMLLGLIGPALHDSSTLTSKSDGPSFERLKPGPNGDPEQLPTKRVRLPIIIEEFQIIYHSLLSELSKYGFTFFLSCQSLAYLQKLDPLLLPAVEAQVKQLIAFHMSAQDAEILHKELGVEREDLVHLDMHTCYAALTVADRLQPTFSLKINPPTLGDSLLAESIRARCRVRYTTAIDQVDSMLHSAMLRHNRQASSSKSHKQTTKKLEAIPSTDLPIAKEKRPKAKKSTRSLMNETHPLPISRNFSPAKFASYLPEQSTDSETE